MRIFISAGEPSGDLHAANLVRSLRAIRPDAEFVGFGGPEMIDAGASLLYPLVELSVMWLARVLVNIHKFLAIVDQADQFFRDHRPDVVVLIDYPGLHWWIARKAKARGIPVVYYVPPQLWAWAGWRVKKVRQFVDLVLCSLPFEPAWYQARGVAGARYVGHPYFDELQARFLDETFLAAEHLKGGRIVALLPGSRTQEVTRNMPLMLRAAKRLAQSHQGMQIRFAVACLRQKHQALVEAMIVAEGVEGLPIDIHVGRTAELIRLAEVAWAVSGSVGLELMMEALPTVVLYKISRLDLLVARRFINSKYISLVNLLADAEVMPEYLTPVDTSRELAEWAGRWLGDPAERARASAVLATLRDRVAVPGASDRAAAEIMTLIETGGSALRGPHERLLKSLESERASS